MNRIKKAGIPLCVALSAIVAWGLLGGFAPARTIALEMTASPAQSAQTKSFVGRVLGRAGTGQTAFGALGGYLAERTAHRRRRQRALYAQNLGEMDLLQLASRLAERPSSLRQSELQYTPSPRAPPTA